MVKVLLDEPRVFVTYGSASVVPRDDLHRPGYGHDEPWADESNGLCGAGVPGVLAQVALDLLEFHDPSAF